jgi:hypothetical protein
MDGLAGFGVDTMQFAEKIDVVLFDSERSLHAVAFV